VEKSSRRFGSARVEKRGSVARRIRTSQLLSRQDPAARIWGRLTAETEDARYARPSDGDIARVLALYPLPPGGWPLPPGYPPQPNLPHQPHNPKRGTRQPKLRVIIGDFTTTVSPAPSQTPIVPGTKEWEAAAKERLGADGQFMGTLDDEVLD